MTRSSWPKPYGMKALLCGAIRVERLGEEILARFSPGPAVTLRGFHLLTSVGAHTPLTWFTEPVDEQELLQAYQALLEPTKLHPQRKSLWVANAFSPLGLSFLFSEPRLPRERYAPGAVLMKLLACSGIPGELYSTPWAGKIITDLARYEVTPSSFWCNRLNRKRRYAQEATDLDLSELQVPDIVTDHPLARAVVGAEAPAHIQAMAHAYIRFDFASPKSSLYRLLPSSRTKRTPRRPHPVAKAAVEEVRGLLDENRLGVGQEVYRVLVGGGMARTTACRLLGAARVSESNLSTHAIARLHTTLNDLH